MKNIKALALAIGLLPVFVTLVAAGLPGIEDLVVVVDKKTFKMHLANYNDGHLDIKQTFRFTMGQNVGDKLMEGDKKTPEGIYDFLFRTQAPALKPKFGPRAIYVGYPNVMDKIGGKTGFDILIHGTDTPERLEKQFDSLGCVVTDNDNVKIVYDNVKVNETKVIITKDFSALADTPRLPRAKAFFEKWVNAWSNKDTVTYIESYADEFKMDGMNKFAYAKYKDALNKKYDTISVKAENVHFYFHEKYDLITFTQRYNSTFPGGRQAYSGVSKKKLWIQERNGVYRIIMEESGK